MNEVDTEANAEAVGENEHDHARPDGEGVPEGGNPKFVGKDGAYNWQAHARDSDHRIEQSRRDRAANEAKREAEAASADGLYLDPDPQGEGEEGEGNAPPPRLDLEKYTAEYGTHGSLSEASYAELERAGIPPELVDAYVDGQQARAEQTKQSVYAVVGGADEYAALLAWAKDTLTQPEIESFNALANSADLNGFRLAVSGLHGRYQDEEGGTRAKTRITGDGGGGSSGGAYGSWAEVTKDMRDPRYKTDETYRSSVAAKLARSPLNGVRVSEDRVYRS